MDNITLSLTLQQANIIFAALTKMPYESVAQLIQDLNQQIEPQVSKDRQLPSSSKN